jgi:hypothetical protein
MSGKSITCRISTAIGMSSKMLIEQFGQISGFISTSLVTSAGG